MGMMKRESCGGWAGPSTAPSPPARVGGMLAWRAAPRPGAAGPALPVFGAVCLNFRQMLFAKFAAGSGAFAGSSGGCAPWSCSRPRAALRCTVRAVSTATEGQCPALLLPREWGDTGAGMVSTGVWIAACLSFPGREGNLQGIGPRRNGITGKAVTLLSKYNGVKGCGAVCAPRDLLSGGGIH